MRSLQKTRGLIAVVILTCVPGTVTGVRAGVVTSAPVPARVVSSFDTNWLFFKGDPTEAEQPELQVK